jgi:hypothetical protein
MSTVTVPREVTSQEVVDALRNNLDPRYDVLPGMRMPQAPFGIPRPGAPELILVSLRPMVRAQVTVTRRGGQTDLRISPGGLLGDLLMNTLGIARKVRQALLTAPSLNASGPSQ